MMKRLGASAGVIWRQFSSRSPRIRVSNSNAAMPSPSALAWITLADMRRVSDASP